MRNIQIMQVFQSLYDVEQLRIECEGNEVRINLLLPHRQELYEPTKAGGPDVVWSHIELCYRTAPSRKRGKAEKVSCLPLETLRCWDETASSMSVHVPTESVGSVRERTRYMPIICSPPLSFSSFGPDICERP